MTTSRYDFDWNELAFGDKKPLRDLKATFIMAPREMSAGRFTQLVRQYLPKGNMVVGLAKEDYIDGFDGQPHFRTLRFKTIEQVIAKVNAAKTPYKIYTLSYFQREAKAIDAIIDKLHFKHVVLVNGSWLHAFHNRSTYYLLANKHIPYDMVSPFAGEEEALQQAEVLSQAAKKAAGLPSLPDSLPHTQADMLAIANLASRLSFDYNFQIGVALGKKTTSNTYRLLAYTHNNVVPYETYAMHHGASREQHFSPPYDLNHYDTVHAEINAIIEAQQQRFDLDGSTLFINLLPCPTCARSLSRTSITEIVYREDHSDGYAIKMLELAGKKVRHLV